jgi:hypothetical protein
LRWPGRDDLSLVVPPPGPPCEGKGNPMRRLLAGLSVALLFGVALSAADPPSPKPATPPAATDAELERLKQQAAFDQERLRRQFNAFQQSLLTLKQRLEKSSKPEDREKAAVLQQAIDLAGKEGVDNQFSKLVSTLTANGITIQEINGAIGQNQELVKTLREMIAILLTDSQSARNREEQKRLEDLLKQLEKVIRNQKVERSKVESGKVDKDALAKGQRKVTQDTKGLHRDMGKVGEKDGKPKENEGKAKEGQPKEGQPKDGKGQPKDGQPKAGEPKDGKGEPKDGQPKDGKGQPKSGQPKQGQPKDGQPQQGEPKEGDNKPNDQQPPPPDEAMPGRKQVQEAIENQQNAEKKIQENKKDDASTEQDEAIKKLEEVRKEIERRLRQLREEELERLLANLEARCRRMLALQIEVYEGTKRLHGTIQANEGQKPTRVEDLKAGELSGREGQIVTEANKALQLLEEDGSSVAFPQVLEQVRDDMKGVQARLFKTDVGPFTQGIEEDIIAQLKEMVEALKKQQQELKDKKNQPPPPGGQPPPQTLINLLAELKMIRSRQLQINKRTTAYGKEYPGEQADDPNIQGELHKLGQQQNKIQKATKDIATGKAGGG